jgi:Ca2+/Na+ antiporter
MGIIILITTIIFELVFTTFCIIKRSNPISIRNTIRITAFPLFVFFTLVSVIRWSFRYWLLAAFLLVLFIIGIVNLIRNNEKKKKYSSLKITGKSLFMIILLFLVSLPAIIFPQIKHIKPTGEYKVKTVKYTYVDKNRVETYTNTGEFREVNVEYWYPENAEGTFPLVVFSHGTFGVKASNYTLFNELASHGYVVCSIDHPYHSFEP